MYFESDKKEECFGCKACQDVCSVQAIHFKADEEGFEYPIVDEDKCVNCNLCKKKCSCGDADTKTELQVYAAWHRESHVRASSSSGGIFYPLAELVLKNQGFVVGAAFLEEFRVGHIIVESLRDLSKLQKSKYVQSDTECIYRKVEELLKREVFVLYSGTPCQIAAMNKYLNKKYDNIIYCEVLCYGVPSPKVYKKYLEYLELEYRSKIKKINFKDKRYGWDYYATAIEFVNGKKICKFGGDSYRKFMHNGLSLRPSCLECTYGLRKSQADISLGDFYNVTHYMSGRIPKNGVSCVLVRSSKGRELFSEIQDLLEVKEIKDPAFLKKEEQEKFKKKQVVDRNEFYSRLNAHGYKAILPMTEKKFTLREMLTAFRLRYLYELRK